MPGKTEPAESGFPQDLDRPLFYKRFAEVLDKIVDPMKKADNPHLSSKYATLEQHVDAIKAAIAGSKIGYTQFFDQQVDYGENAGGQVLVTRVFDTETGQYLDSRLDMTAILESSASKNVFQALGSGITYARRYALSAMFNIVAGDDDGSDGPSRKASGDRPARKAKDEATKAKNQDNETTGGASVDDDGGVL